MKAIVDTYRTQIKENIKNWGTDVNVTYYTTSQPSPGLWDPINNEPVNPSTALTIDGWVRTNQTLIFKGAVNTFVNQKAKMDRSLGNFGYIPESDIRVTFWLEDVLINHHSATGTTYLDNCEEFQVFGKKYKPKDKHRTGIDSIAYVYIVTGDEIKG